MKRLSAFLMLSVMAGALGACGDAETDADSGSAEGGGGDSEETYSFKLAHITPTSHMWHEAAERFGEELEEMSDGRMTLEIYPASQLGTEGDMVQQIEAGSIDFGLITAAYLSSRSNAFSAWFTPYAFETLEEAHEARQSDVAKDILGTLEEQGLIGLDYLFAGQRVMLFRDREVQSPEDMEGLTLRVTPSPPLQDFYRYTGAASEGLPLPEVYAAVQTGVIDGMDMDLDATITNNYHEVVDYGAVTNHMVWPSVALVNQDLFEGMTEGDQQIIRDAFEAAADHAVTTRSAQEEDFKQQLTDAGMTIYELDSEVFAEQIEQFDENYGPQDPLIQEFIDTFR
ncbi:TRAP transporter substrate-binding protein [Alteribacter natronophilus]|uniref:TRAP transporter substrate-binding protein n=1 Tax=Alteribacter natronophilus TaxID=2583810 RepID=UPI00110D3D56|nr:TRAP transporter substrate-binding protein [Alteribacter natronophilus]TMW70760.1 TRAP transporter substrate-binding protein [Alteribacter natronophilus]